jgi:hypothetical protein
MALDLREEADERSLVRTLRRLLEANGGRLRLARRSLDGKAGSSIHAAVLEVDARLAPQREKNRGYSRAAYERRTAAAAPEVATPAA